MQQLLCFISSLFSPRKSQLRFDDVGFFFFFVNVYGYEMIPLEKITVCLDRCLSYDAALLQPILQDHLDILAVSENLCGKRILLKPNLISAKSSPLSCSSPLFTAAVASCFLARGATVLLGDSPALGSAVQVLERQGFTAALKGMDIEYVPFKTVTKKTLACGVTVGVAAEAFNCDLFVNLPRIKAHDQMAVTMAVKNVYGIVLGARKAWLHMSHGHSHAEFAEMILSLQQLLPPTLALADGIEVMNKRGPTTGGMLFLGCVAAANNFVALDRALLALLEVDTANSPLALAAQKEGLAGAFLQELTFPQLQPQDFAGSGFQVPASLVPVRFQPLHYLKSSVKRFFLHLSGKED